MHVNKAGMIHINNLITQLLACDCKCERKGGGRGFETEIGTWTGATAVVVHRVRFQWTDVDVMKFSNVVQ